MALPERSDGVSPERVVGARPSDDTRSGRPYLLTGAPFHTLIRRGASVLALVTMDVGGLIIGLYAALAAAGVRRRPASRSSGGCSGTRRRTGSPFLILVLILVFWRAGLYAAGSCARASAGSSRACLLVAALSLAFAIGSGQHFTTFGLYVVGALFVSALIGALPRQLRAADRRVLRAAGVRRRAVLVGDARAARRLRSELGAARGGIDYGSSASSTRAARSRRSSPRDGSTSVIVADAGLDEERLLEIVEAAHRRASRCGSRRARRSCSSSAASTSPATGCPCSSCGRRSSRAPTGRQAQLRPRRRRADRHRRPAGLAADRAARSSSPRAGRCSTPIPAIGLGEQPFEMLKFRTMVAGADAAAGAARGGERSDRRAVQDPRRPAGDPVGRVLRRLSLDEVPNVINVLRGEMSLVGPRPLPLATTSGSRLAPPPLQRPAGHDRPLADRRALRSRRSTTSSGSTSTTSRTGRSGSTSRSSSARRRRSWPPRRVLTRRYSFSSRNRRRISSRSPLRSPEAIRSIAAGAPGRPRPRSRQRSAPSPPRPAGRRTAARGHVPGRSTVQPPRLPPRALSVLRRRRHRRFGWVPPHPSFSGRSGRFR